MLHSKGEYSISRSLGIILDSTNVLWRYILFLQVECYCLFLQIGLKHKMLYSQTLVRYITEHWKFVDPVPFLSTNCPKFITHKLRFKFKSQKKCTYMYMYK